MPRIAVVGSRSFKNYDLLASTLEVFLNAWKYTFEAEEFVIISGGARGADKLAEKYVEEAKRCLPTVTLKVFKADWSKYGSKAGPLRNQQIVDFADMIIAFWDKQSRGTRDTIKKAFDAGKPIFIIPFADTQGENKNVKE